MRTAEEDWVVVTEECWDFVLDFDEMLEVLFGCVSVTNEVDVDDRPRKVALDFFRMLEDGLGSSISSSMMKADFFVAGGIINARTLKGRAASWPFSSSKAFQLKLYSAIPLLPVWARQLALTATKLGSGFIADRAVVHNSLI